MKLCAVVASKSERNALDDIKAANKEADFVELRVDYLKKINETILTKLISASKKPVIISCRSSTNKGKFTGNETERFEVLKNAIFCGANFVEVELNSDESLRKELFKNKGASKIILSKYDFVCTPKPSELIAQMNEMFFFSPEVIKIVCLAHDVEENVRVFKLIRKALELEIKIVSYCLGFPGQISRIFSPFFGAYFTCGSLRNRRKVEAGEMTLKKIKKFGI